MDWLRLGKPMMQAAWALLALDVLILLELATVIRAL